MPKWPPRGQVGQEEGEGQPSAALKWVGGAPTSARVERDVERAIAVALARLG
ncbi:MAG: hypothetical protein Q3999_08170 [Buchananella hordeovulneris]|nr:hypothetical protein [Buchananella hordeovulneris]